VHAIARVRAKPATMPSFPTVRAHLPHRKCACDGTPNPGGGHVAYRGERLSLQRRATSQPTPLLVVQIVYGDLRVPGQLFDAAPHAVLTTLRP
jgi:hypothetical protein